MSGANQYRLPRHALCNMEGLYMSDPGIPKTTRKVPQPRKLDQTDVIARRDYFAAHAPEAPDWFVARNLPAKPINALRALAEAGRIEDKDFLVVNQWAKGDGVLPTELDWIKDEHRIYLEQREAWERDCGAARFFAWRWHYADQMVRFGSMSSDDNA